MRTAKEERDCRLDLMKAIAIIFVLLWHLQPVKIYPNTLSGNYLYYSINFFYNNITLTAVPMFYLISIILFFDKVRLSSNYIQKRIIRIVYIFLFWAIFQTLIYFLSLLFFKHMQWAWPIKYQPLWKHIIMGGPSLPYVGDSVFYFLFNLILLTLISFIYSKIKEIWRTELGFFLIIIYFIYFIKFNTLEQHIPYWRIDNFIVYIALADIFSRKKNSIYLPISLFLFILSIAYEYNNNLIYSIYSRNSILFGTTSIYLVIGMINFKECPKKIKLLSLFSLGIFAIHKYWMMIFIVVLSILFSFLAHPQNLWVNTG